MITEDEYNIGESNENIILEDGGGNLYKTRLSILC